jgi:hypothetical protein
MSHPNRAKQRWRKWAGDQATAIVNQNVDECLAAAKLRFQRSLSVALRRYGSFEAIHMANQLNRPKAKRKRQTANVITDLSGKAYVFASKKRTVPQKKYRTLTVGQTIVLRRVSRDMGNQLRLTSYGFEFKRFGWQVNKSLLKKDELIADYPQLKDWF